MNFWQKIADKVGEIVASILLLVGIGGQQPANINGQQISQDPIAVVSVQQLPENQDVVIKATIPAKNTNLAQEVVSEPVEIGAPSETPAITTETAPQSIYVPIYITNPEPEPVTEDVQTSRPSSEPLAPEPDKNEPKIMEYTIDIISPVSIKGLGREYYANKNVKDEMNYIYIGAVLKDSDGNVINNVEMKVTATDGSQNKNINGTGTIANTYVNGQKIPVYCYPYTYEFRTAGDHQITFSANGVSKTVEIKGLVDDPR